MSSIFPRLTTGIAGLDKVLHGGLPKGSWVLVIGPPGSGKSTLGRQFLHTAVTANREAVLLSTADHSEVIKEAMLSFGWVDKYIDRIQVIDCYSWRQGIHTSPIQTSVGRTSSPVNMKNLTDVSIAITEFFDKRHIKIENNPCFVIDSFTDFLLNSDGKNALSFLSQLKSKLHQRGVTTLVLLEEGVHFDNIVAAAQYLMDGTIRAKFDETSRYIMVSRMLATPVQLGWREFTIRKGIDLVVKGFFGGAGR